MAYDPDLADRIRGVLAGEPAVVEKAMFGGLAFLAGGNMAVAASGHGGLLVRVDPAETEDLLASPGVRIFEMRGRSMRGWLRVDDAEVGTPDELAAWVGRGLAFARSLPAKA